MWFDELGAGSSNLNLLEVQLDMNKHANLNNTSKNNTYSTCLCFAEARLKHVNLDADGKLDPIDDQFCGRAQTHGRRFRFGPQGQPMLLND